MLSLPFWAAFATVFFGLKWLSDVWISLPEPKRRSSPGPVAITRRSSSAPVPVGALRKAA